MVALGARRGHDRCVGDRRTMVAAHGARHTCGNAHDAHGVVQREDRHGNGDEHAERSPACPCRKSQQAADQEHDGRQEHLHAFRAAFHKVPHKIFRAQRIRHGFQRPCECEDHNGRHHRLKAVRDAAHHLAEGHCPAQHIINEAEHQSECGPKHQPYRRVGV